MTTNTLKSFNHDVVRDDTNKNGKKWLKLTSLALFGTLLFGKVSDWNAQEVVTQERNEITKEIVVSRTQAEIDSTISYDEAKQLLNGEKREISTEEIQEYIQNNREEFEEYVKNNGEELNKIIDENIDKQTMDVLYEELANNEDIRAMINEMVNRDDIREAIIKWNTEYAQEQIKEELYQKFNLNRFAEIIGQGVIFLVKLAFYGFIWLCILYVIDCAIKAIKWKFKKEK